MAGVETVWELHTLPLRKVIHTSLYYIYFHTITFCLISKLEKFGKVNDNNIIAHPKEIVRRRKLMMWVLAV